MTETRSPARITSTIAPAIAIVALASIMGGCIPLIFAGAVGGAAAFSSDRRTSDTILADERIELTAAARLRAGLGEKINTSVTSFNRVVLVSGQVADNPTKGAIDKIVSEVPGVRYVVDETTLKPFRNFGQRSNDGYVTTQVKARMVAQAKNVNPLQVKVVTDDSVVYLLGMVTKFEAEEASGIAASTAGVTRVVRVFEYVPDDVAKPPAKNP